MGGKSEKLLIVGPAWVGDIVMTQALLKLLKQREPTLQIDVIAPDWATGLVERMPEVQRAIAIAAGHGRLDLRERWQLGRTLRAEGYGHGIVLPRSFKSALVPFFARVPERVGFATEMRSVLLTDARPLDRVTLDQTVKRFLALGLPLNAPLPEPPAPALRIDTANQAALMTRFTLRSPAVAMMPGAAYGPAKQWPVEHYAELAHLLAARGFEIWVFGSAGEKPLGDLIAAAAGNSVRNLCGCTRLEDTVDLMSAAQAAITNDSGLMHIAAAAGTHVVAIYGSTSPQFTPPLTGRKTIHYLGLECSPCFQRECPLQHLNCLRGIDARAVAQSVTTP